MVARDGASHHGYVTALAVFEDLELADYGNRIPFLTFELFVDASPPTAFGYPFG
jgi:hypothetical protein